MVTWTEMIEITGATELSTVATAHQDAVLLSVGLQVDEDDWGDLYDVGCAYLAAHLAAMGRRRGTSGVVSSESVGSVSRSYSSSVAQGAATLGATTYGTEYERLMMLNPAFRFTVSS